MTPTSTVSRTESLVGRLPSVNEDQAAAMRLVFDRRFQRWTRRLWKGHSLSVHAPARRHTIELEVHTANGVANFGVDPAAWPALQAAADLPDAKSADAVLTLLLTPLLAPLEGVCHPLSIHRSERGSRRAIATILIDGEVSLDVFSCSPAFAAHLRQFTAGLGRTDVLALGGLRLSGRLVLMTHRWNNRVLASLAPGDVVLAPSGRAGAARWRLGVGRRPDLPIRIDLERNTLQIERSQRAGLAFEPAVNDPATSTAAAISAGAVGTLSGSSGAEGPPAVWSTLELPVSFELDTARISMAELAALKPGSAIELDQHLEDAVVRLMCQGQTLGQGQLVAIGERLGVRITRMGLLEADSVRA